MTIINDEHDREEFDAMEDESVRIIGYFEPGSVGQWILTLETSVFFSKLNTETKNVHFAALKEFEEAAEDFMGEIEFFAVVDSRVS